MPLATTGLHHVLGTARHAQRTCEFFTGVLGMRLVKQTVDREDPRLHFLYFADAQGTPGTVIGFVADPGAPRGFIGAGSVRTVMLAVPPNSLGFWRQHLDALQVPFWDARDDFSPHKIGLQDPDGFNLELVGTSDLPGGVGASAVVPPHYAVRGLHGVRLRSRNPDATRDLLTALGWWSVDRRGGVDRLAIGAPGRRQSVWVEGADGGPEGRTGVGCVRRVLFRSPGSEFPPEARAELQALGLEATGPLDRTYFTAFGFTDPGGLALGLATEGPGFTVDEPEAHLGTALCLPLELEPQRDRIARMFPPVGVSLR